MESYEVLREAIEKIGAKAVAAELKLSQALVYKWCEEPGPGACGARTPLDRLAEVVRVTGDSQIVNWLCGEAGGFLVANPRVREGHVDTDLLVNASELVQEFSQLLVTVTRSFEDDGRITQGEAERIRRCWERLKASAEGFTIACERGLYSRGE